MIRKPIMPEQSDFPEKWSCDSDAKTVMVEVSVPNDSGGYDWIEIPSMDVEQWVQKGEAAELQRTAKVRYPTEWGDDTATVDHNSPRRLIDDYDADDRPYPFQLCRIYWRQGSDYPWHIGHFGWIGGNGTADTDSVHKFWVYDFAELLSGVPIGVTFNNPSVEAATESITDLTTENTPIPIEQAQLVPPETEQELLISTDVFEQSDFDDTGDVGLGLTDDQIADIGETFEDSAINTGDIPLFGLRKKSFVSNRDTLLDVYKWFEKKTSASLWFQPLGDGVKLVADIEPTRHRFVQNEVLLNSIEQGDEYLFHRPVSVMNNTALYEIKPYNTIRLRGDTSGSFLGREGFVADAVDTVNNQLEDIVLGSGEFFTGGLLDPEPPAEKYPAVTLQHEDLLEAANGTELSPEVIESDAGTIETAKNEAYKEFEDLLSEKSEGEVELFGEPQIMPFDALDAYETCGDYVQYEQEPVRYEVESVKHEKFSDDVYRTRIKVSVWANREEIEVVRDEMVTAEGAQ